MKFVASPHPNSRTRHLVDPMVAGVSTLDPAICGAFPHHSLNDWIQTPQDTVNCSKCIKKQGER